MPRWQLQIARSTTKTKNKIAWGEKRRRKIIGKRKECESKGQERLHKYQHWKEVRNTLYADSLRDVASLFCSDFSPIPNERVEFSSLQLVAVRKLSQTNKGEGKDAPSENRFSVGTIFFTNGLCIENSFKQTTQTETTSHCVLSLTYLHPRNWILSFWSVCAWRYFLKSFELLTSFKKTWAAHTHPWRISGHLSWTTMEGKKTGTSILLSWAGQ